MFKITCEVKTILSKNRRLKHCNFSKTEILIFIPVFFLEFSLNFYGLVMQHRQHRKTSQIHDFYFCFSFFDNDLTHQIHKCDTICKIVHVY